MENLKFWNLLSLVTEYRRAAGGVNRNITEFYNRMGCLTVKVGDVMICDMAEKRKKRDYKSVQLWPETDAKLEELLNRLSTPFAKPTRTKVLHLLVNWAAHLQSDALHTLNQDVESKPNPPPPSVVRGIAEDVEVAKNRTARGKQSGAPDTPHKAGDPKDQTEDSSKTRTPKDRK